MENKSMMSSSFILLYLPLSALQLSDAYSPMMTLTDPLTMKSPAQRPTPGRGPHYSSVPLSVLSLSLKVVYLGLFNFQSCSACNDVSVTAMTWTLHIVYSFNSLQMPYCHNLSFGIILLNLCSAQSKYGLGRAIGHQSPMVSVHRKINDFLRTSTLQCRMTKQLFFFNTTKFYFDLKGNHFQCISISPDDQFQR